MDAFNDFIGSITAIIWADWVLYTVLAVGLLFTLWSGLCQYRALDARHRRDQGRLRRSG